MAGIPDFSKYFDKKFNIRVDREFIYDCSYLRIVHHLRILQPRTDVESRGKNTRDDVSKQGPVYDTVQGDDDFQPVVSCFERHRSAG